MKLLVPLAVLCAGVVFAGAARADSSDLAVAYQLNAAHSGVQSGSSLGPRFARRWEVSLPGLVSYPLIAQGMVFVTAGDNANKPPWLYALDGQSGEVVWSQSLPYPWPWANAAYDNGRIFVVGSIGGPNNRAGLMEAFDAGSGVLLWSTTLRGDLFTAPPTAANGLVYTTGNETFAAVYALDEETGTIVATSPRVIQGDISSPTLGGGGVYVGYACNSDFAFAQATLALLWYYPASCSGGGGKTTVYADGRLYTRDSYGDLILDVATGRLLGTYSSYLAPAVDQDSMFTLTFPNYPSSTLAAHNLSDGSTRWTFVGDGRLDTAPIVVDGAGGRLVIEGSSSGRLYALDANNGTPVWSTDVGAPILQPDEQSFPQPLTGLAAGQGLLVVPASNTVSAYVTDTTAPTITTPGVVTARATSGGGATVSYTVGVTDPDDPATVSCSPASGATFPVGTTIVHCIASDSAGNTATASFQVIVQPDTTAPTITVPAIVTAAATSAAGATVTYSVSASDPDDTATITCTPLSGSQFPVGTTIVACTATDGSGNSASAGFPVVVSAPGADCDLSHYTATKGTLNLKNANLSGCYLPGANLSGATATNANMAGAYLAGANLSSANLSQANLRGALLTHADLTGATWNRTTCPDGTDSNNDGGTCLGHIS